MALYNLTGHRRCSADCRKTACKHLTALLQIRAYIRSFVKILIETNVNISNEHNFLMFIQVLTTLHCKQTLHKPLLGLSTLHMSQWSLHFHNLRKMKFISSTYKTEYHYELLAESKIFNFHVWLETVCLPGMNIRFIFPLWYFCLW